MQAQVIRPEEHFITDEPYLEFNYPNPDLETTIITKATQLSASLF